ncbi:hypothetical protein KRMM14A1004_34500 [Krasilnikovia sp. MM14-A1004]
MAYATAALAAGLVAALAALGACGGPGPAPVPPPPPPSAVTRTPTAPPTVRACATDALLVPACGVLWGASAGGFTAVPRDRALKAWEGRTGRTATIFHTYHRGDDLFPTRSEIAMTRDPARPRVLLVNWRVDDGVTWAQVARGAVDERIDRWARHVRRTYRQRFFLVVRHEPEADVDPRPGSGMTARDFALMYRHVIERVRADGVDNAITVLAYMGSEKWQARPWWSGLYPGDDVVDWIGLDSYVSAEPGRYHFGGFADLLDRRPDTGGSGFYDWATTRHPGKPVMVAEWGVYHRVGRPADKAPEFASVLPELRRRPAIKAIVYFDTDNDAYGDRDISVDSSASSLAAFRRLATDPLFDVTVNDP